MSECKECKRLTAGMVKMANAMAVQVATIERLLVALEEAARHIASMRDEWSVKPVNADDRAEWPEYIRAALTATPAPPWRASND